MKDTNTLEASGSGTRTSGKPDGNGNGRFDAAGVQLGVKAPVKRNALAGLLTDVEAVITDADKASGAVEEDLRTRFVAALGSHQKTTESLAAIVSEAIEAGFDREDVIEWGYDAGFSDGYVRATVSRLFIDLVGRVRTEGGGRKANKGAQGYADRVLRECGGSYPKAMALLLATRRLLEKAAKSAVKA